MQKWFLSYTRFFLSNTHTQRRGHQQQICEMFSQITFRRLRDVTLRARHWPHFLLSSLTPPTTTTTTRTSSGSVLFSISNLISHRTAVSKKIKSRPCFHSSYGSAVPNQLIPSEAKATNGCEKVITFNHSRRNLRRFISFQGDSLLFFVIRGNCKTYFNHR